MTTETHEDDAAALSQFESQTLAALDATAKDEPILESPEDPNQPAPPQAAPSPPAPTPAPAALAAPAAPVAAPTPPAQQEDKNRGDLRAALRASRHQERLMRERLEDMERQIADLQAGRAPAPQPAGTPTDMEAYIKEVELNFPEQGKVLRAMQQQLTQLQSLVPKPPPKEPEFAPERLSAELQEVVDDVPELLAMQTTKEMQDQWMAAKALDAALSVMPAWKDKPLQQRFAEVVRQVKQQFGAPPAPPVDPAAAVQAAVNRAQPRAPTTLSDLGGGVAPQQISPNYHAMDDAQVMAALARLS